MSAFLLDTNVVVWLLTGNREAIPDPVVSALQDRANRVIVSAASTWEIAVKRSIGKLTLDDGWAPALGALDVEQLPISSLHAEAVEQLPWHHRDPFDRLLVAQAIVERATLVSADARLGAYDAPVFWG